MTKICTSLHLTRKIPYTTGRANEPENQIRVKACAERVFARYAAREEDGGGWCEYCGVGDKAKLVDGKDGKGEKEGKGAMVKGRRGLKRCGGCKERRVWYCSDEHQKEGWKMHRLLCEGRMFGPEKAPTVAVGGGKKNEIMRITFPGARREVERITGWVEEEEVDE